MSDINVGLPIRTENAGDAIVKIADATTPSKQLTVNSDGSINAVVSATDLDIRNLLFATDKVDASGSVIALDAPTLTALESITVQNGAGASAVNIQDGGNSITVDAVDLDMRNLSASQDNVAISDGTDSLAINTDGSINVRVLDNTPGTSITDYNTVANVAGGATSTHTYTSIGNFYLTQVEASGSGKLKIEIQVNSLTRFVQFNSPANPNMSVVLSQPILVTSGQTVTVIRTNRENQSQDVYSSISGYNQ